MIKKQEKAEYLRKVLSEWHATCRPLHPWKETKDPYKIWVSEIIMQQTRIRQGTSYYLRFVLIFPNINALAKAKEDEVLSVWKGLGYYSRARNMQISARIIIKKHKGIFPRNYNDILALKGIGPYTASAIASFAFGLPHAVLDGNVFRVLSRIFGIFTPIDSHEGKKAFTRLSGYCLDHSSPGEYNQSIMDFGAIICKPISPLCRICQLKFMCKAYMNDVVKKLPQKRKKTKQKKRFFYYFLIDDGTSIAVQKRKQKDIWRGLYELPMVELSSDSEDIESLCQQLSEIWNTKINEDQLKIIDEKKQLLSHQMISGKFYHIFNFPILPEWTILSKKRIAQTAMPKIVDVFLSDYVVNS